MKAIAGIRTRSGDIENVKLEEMRAGDWPECVSVIVNRYEAAEEAEARELLLAVKEAHDLAGEAEARTYPDGNPYLLVRNAGPNPNVSEYRAKLEAAGVL